MTAANRHTAIDRYLRTGTCDDIDHLQWPGQNIMEKGRNGHDDHVRALVAEVKRRAKRRTHSAVPELDLTSWTRRKLTPMVHGFFAERETVLRLFEKSIVCDERMDPKEVADIVQVACRAGNGWKVILGRCSPQKRSTRRSNALTSTAE